jgi:hypothetical protein
LFTHVDVALSEKGTTFTRQTAIVIAQRFLDWNLIADVEGETVRGSKSEITTLTGGDFRFTFRPSTKLDPMMTQKVLKIF